LGLGQLGSYWSYQVTQQGVLVEGVTAGQRVMGVTEPTGVLWGQRGTRRKQQCRSRGWGASIVLANSGNTAVNNVALSGGA